MSLKIVPQINRGRDGSTISEVYIEFGKESLRFNMSIYARSKVRAPELLFEPINTYWAKLPAETQRDIFKIYQDISDTISMCTRPRRLTSDLQELIKVLLAYHPIDDIYRHSMLNVNMITNEKIKHHLTEEDKGKESKTYIVEDYVNLMVLSHVLKVLAPVWSAYMREVRAAVGNGFKEIFALSLINGTELIKSKAVVRLQEYLEAQHSAAKSIVGIMNTLSSEDIGEYLLALAMVKSLAMAETQVDNNNLISNIYRATYDSANKLGTEFNSDRVQIKRDLDDTNVSEQEKRSHMEQYRLSSPVTNASIVDSEHYISLNVQVAKEIDPTIPIKLVKECVRFVKKNDIDILSTDVRNVLAGNILNYGIPFLTSDVIVNSYSVEEVGIAQALLIHWGFDFLAALMSAKCNPLDIHVVRSEVVTGGTLSVISKETVERLHKLLPHYRVPRNSKGRGRNDNYGVVWVEIMVRDIMRLEWYYCHPDSVKIDTADQSFVSFPGTLREQLAQLILKIND